MTWRITEVSIAKETKAMSMEIKEYDDDWKPTKRSVTFFAENLIDLMSMATPFTPDNLGTLYNGDKQKKSDNRRSYRA